MSDRRFLLRTIGVGAVVACGAYQVALGLYFVFWRPSLLPEDLRFMGGSAAALRAAAPDVEAWLQWVFAVMGGQMIGVGVLALLAAKRVRQDGGASVAEMLLLILAAAATAALMSVVNFAIGSDFRWALVVPVLLWIFALLSFSGSLRR